MASKRRGDGRSNGHEPPTGATDIWFTNLERDLQRVVDSIRFGELVEALELADSIAARARSASDEFALGRALMFAAEIELLCGRLDHAKGLADEAERTLRKICLWGGVSRVCRLMAGIARANGDLGEASVRLADALEAAVAIPDRSVDADVKLRNIFESHVAAADLLREERRTRDGLARLEEAAELADELSDPILRGDLLLVRGQLVAESDVEEGIELIRRAQRIFSNNRITLRAAYAFEAEGECLLDSGDVVGAHRAFKRALAHLEGTRATDCGRVEEILRSLANRMRSDERKRRQRRSPQAPVAATTVDPDQTTLVSSLLLPLLEPGLRFQEFCRRLLAAIVRDFRLCDAAAIVQDLGGESLRVYSTFPDDLPSEDLLGQFDGSGRSTSHVLVEEPSITLEMRSFASSPPTPSEGASLKLLTSLARLQITDDVLAELSSPRRPARDPVNTHGMVIVSYEMRTVLDMIYRAAHSDCTVLIIGESGTGKERLARVIHEESNRASHHYLATNCAAIPAELVESKLFGHRKGAFTGATADSPGLFTAADKGTLFLDEIGELPLATQPKLLRALDLGEIEPIGSVTPVHVDTRVIAATNRDLEREVAAGRFREDLYHRLNVVLIVVPPLRARPTDILPLARHFIAKARDRNGVEQHIDIHPTAETALLDYPWPGNVRELENVITRALLMNGFRTVRLSDLQLRSKVGADGVGGAVRSDDVRASTYDGALAEAGRRVILEVLQEAAWSRTDACKRLGMTRGRFYRVVNQLGLDLESLERDER